MISFVNRYRQLRKPVNRVVFALVLFGMFGSVLHWLGWKFLDEDAHHYANRHSFYIVAPLKFGDPNYKQKYAEYQREHDIQATRKLKLDPKVYKAINAWVEISLGMYALLFVVSLLFFHYKNPLSWVNTFYSISYVLFLVAAALASMS
ncbi:MAG: hypothetical protein EB060_06160 [Proteobacteria bacterium]|nr:hypothetical protein [Pseudomonadota bacterium]